MAPNLKVSHPVTSIMKHAIRRHGECAVVDSIQYPINISSSKQQTEEKPHCSIVANTSSKVGSRSSFCPSRDAAEPGAKNASAAERRKTQRHNKERPEDPPQQRTAHHIWPGHQPPACCNQCRPSFLPSFLPPFVRSFVCLFVCSFAVCVCVCVCVLFVCTLFVGSVRRPRSLAGWLAHSLGSRSAVCRCRHDMPSQ